jgi:hypothetical protein
VTEAVYRHVIVSAIRVVTVIDRVFKAKDTRGRAREHGNHAASR